ncbi:phage NrS-1 polymerase family protein [Halorarius litoreus]|uniref:phage NrS-1 polymerase family protein n=1 Tax=Halorarius litoreus TaxID=2962676 RepID=UPI0020CBE3E8|nr:hypothetical protein [Halorarius litoreus]
MTERALPPADALPAAMVTRPQWLCWRPEDRDGKTTKVPIDPSSGSYASTTDSATWKDFATARDYADLEDIGIGFVFTDDDPLVGVDLDDCRDPTTGELTEWAADIVTRLDSFTEVSPSGTGVHVIVKGTLPEGRNRQGDVELYETARFFTVTGDHVEETLETVAIRDDALAAVHAEYLAPQDTNQSSGDATATEGTPTSATDGNDGNDLGDEELLEKARSAANGEKFDRLYRGNTSGYESQSEADMALCSLLAFWTGGDAHQMDRLFRESGLYREKWDEVHFSDGATYGERTIERAIAGTSDFYGDDGQWSLFPETGTQPTGGGAAEQSQQTADVAAIESLQAEIRRLEAENERLSEELAAERERRETLESELAEQENRGLFSRFRD